MDQKVNEVMWEMPRIKLTRLASGVFCLLVEDTLVNDFVEDHLWDDYDFYETSVFMQPDGVTAVYANYLHADTPLHNLIEALEQLDPNEVERIYKLNH